MSHGIPSSRRTTIGDVPEGLEHVSGPVGRAMAQIALRRAALEARTTLSILRTQISIEIGRGVDRWEGVPDEVHQRIKAIDEAVAALDRAA